MQLPADFTKRIEDAVADESRLHTDLVHEFLADLQVEYPAHVGLLGGLAGTLFGALIGGSRAPEVLIGLVLAIVALGLVIRRQHQKNKLLQRAYVSTNEAYMAYVAERDGHRDSRDRREQLLLWLLTAAVMLRKARMYVAESQANPAAATPVRAAEVCDSILRDMEEARHRCLRYKPDDATYNFHIFRHDRQRDVLTSFARRHGSRVTENNREWRPGTGHAGRCFEDAEILCLPDMEGPEGQGYRRDVKDLDKVLYRAIIDAPIHYGSGTWGVLAVTSGEPGQFSQADFPALALVTDILGVVVAATRWDAVNATPANSRGTRK